MAAEKTLAILGGGETVKGTLINTPTLETGRLILRKFTERDLEWLFLILHDKEVNQFLPWYPIDSIEEAKKFYEERYASKYVQPQAYAYAICLKTDDHPIGYIKWIWRNITISDMGFAGNSGIRDLSQKRAKR